MNLARLLLQNALKPIQILFVDITVGEDSWTVYTVSTKKIVPTIKIAPLFIGTSLWYREIF